MFYQLRTAYNPYYYRIFAFWTFLTAPLYIVNFNFSDFFEKVNGEWNRDNKSKYIRAALCDFYSRKSQKFREYEDNR